MLKTYNQVSKFVCRRVDLSPNDLKMMCRKENHVIARSLILYIMVKKGYDGLDVSRFMEFKSPYGYNSTIELINNKHRWTSQQKDIIRNILNHYNISW